MTRKAELLEGRWCNCCQTVKLPSAFYSVGGGRLDSWCKACRLEWHRQRRLNDPEYQARTASYQKQYWAELKADPEAYAAYLEKQRGRRKHEKYREYNTAYMRKRRNEKILSRTI